MSITHSQTHRHLLQQLWLTIWEMFSWVLEWTYRSIFQDTVWINGIPQYSNWITRSLDFYRLFQAATTLLTTTITTSKFWTWFWRRKRQLTV